MNRLLLLSALVIPFLAARCDCGDPPAACGDGTVQDGEQCDDGNTAAGDGCDATCQSEPPPPACGDGTVDPGEECDDGNTTAGDSCAADCTIEPACGDGTVDAELTEECDDGNTTDGDGCAADCTLEPFCGDGTVDAPPAADPAEECDDGNNTDGDGCAADCTLEPFCGDATVDVGEECDDGNTDIGDGCDAACVLEGGPGCGNGTLDAGEQCDDGGFVAGDGCAADCRFEPGPTCGDGTVDADEQCDDANQTPDDGCELNCTLSAAPTCGDGALDAGEECDDGNALSGDGCATNCFDEPGGFGVFDSDPRVASRLTGATISLITENASGTVVVQLEDCLNDATPAIPLTTVSVGGDGLSVVVTLAADPTIVQSLYRFAAVNGNGEASATQCLFTISPLAPPTVTNVTPPFSFAGISGDGILSDATVQISGTGFVATPSVKLVSVDDPNVSFLSPIVAFTSDLELTAVIPSESGRMPVGNYHVFVTNPDGLQGQYLLDDGAGGRTPGIFEVRDIPPPAIDNIDPQRDPGIGDVLMSIEGSFFQDGALVTFILNEAGDETAPLATTFVDANNLTVTIPGGTLSDGIFPVKVTNPDTQFDVFFVYEQTNSSDGSLNGDSFEPTGRDLVVPRERLGSVEGFDVFGQAHVYVAGGMDDQKAILGSVERASVSVFGNIGPFEISEQYGAAGDAAAREPNNLVTPRAGHTLVRAGSFLYAIGGTNVDPLDAAVADAPALNTIERARILGFETQPAIATPAVLGGNGLAEGTWFYRVAAISAEGESLASREVLATGGGTVRVCWSNVANASSYNIYRSPAADGRFGTTRLLASELAPVPNVQGLLCLDDNGGNDNGVDLTPAPGRLAGSVVAGGTLTDGLYTYRVAAVRDGNETVAGYPATILIDTIGSPGNQTVTLRWDVIPGATYNLYRSLAAGDPAGGERLLATNLADNTFIDDGSLVHADATLAPRDGVQVLAAGSLSKWETLNVTLNEPREGVDAVVVTVFDGNLDTVDDPTYLYVTGGRPSSQAAAYSRTTERARVDLATGTLVNPLDANLTTLAVEAQLLNAGRAYYPLVTNQGQFVTPFPPPPSEPPCGDVDGDGFNDINCGGDDCDDTNADVNPGETEQCGNTVDDDCDALVDCADTDACGADPICQCADPTTTDVDGDTHLVAPTCGDDCNDNDATVFPGSVENCTNTIDEDCDTLVDCDDPDCANDAACIVGCETVLDDDGDGQLEPNCGLDCNDADATICDGCAEVQCDGIDQDCDGNDLCIIAGAAGGGGGGGGGGVRGGGSVFALVQETTDPVLLVAVAGDTDFEANGNNGSSTVEVATIDPATGAIVSWTTQGQGLAGQGSFGQEALLFFGFLYSIPGASSETLGAEPSTEGGTTTRFGFNEASAGAAFINSRSSATASLTVPKAHYSMVRLNARIFSFGGNDGAGATTAVESISQ